MTITIEPRSKTTKNPGQIARECLESGTKDLFCKNYVPGKDSEYTCALQGAKTTRNFGMKGEKPAYFCQKIHYKSEQLVQTFGISFDYHKPFRMQYNTRRKLMRTR